ncbi:hypothetical protein EC036_11290 [Enterobacter cloacae]|nr:hypothetical protein EC036_11290 [Enterobacter cloacae]
MGQPIDVATLPIKSSEKCETSAFGTKRTFLSQSPHKVFAHIK